MLDILSTTAPIYLAIAVGYLAARFGLFDKADLHLLGKYVINIALPAMLLDALTRDRFEDVLNTGYLIAYAAGSLLCLVLALHWARRLAPDEPGAQAYIAMGMVFSNSGYVGFPVMLMALPSVAGVALALNVLVENVLLLPLALSLTNRQEARTMSPWGPWAAIGSTLFGLRKNPIILSILVALTLSLLEIELPSPLSRTSVLFAQASSAIALFTIGGTLHGIPLRELGARVGAITAGKLLLHPLCIWLALTVCTLAGLPPLPSDLRLALLLTGTLPIMSIYPLLGMRHGHEKFCAAALLTTTILSFLTLSGLLALG
ncbi:MAG: AEC family transporter [Candidatus Accumulibacter sp.]|jgi:predicted permease|nr:AEC family transporter [Accumulibacter sp.]